MVSSTHFSGAPVPVPWRKLTKAIVLDVSKDVHTGLGTLGPPLQISMNPPVHAHPHQCSSPSVPSRAQSCKGNTRHGKTGHLKASH